jgi:hypothetical protein
MTAVGMAERTSTRDTILPKTRWLILALLVSTVLLTAAGMATVAA